MKRSKHNCTTPNCLRMQYKLPKNTEEEIQSTVKYFGITRGRAESFLVQVKIIYKEHDLDWDATSKAINKL
jgi:hypothetical protein